MNPSVTDDDRPAGHHVRPEDGKKECGFRHIVHRGEFVIHDFFQHDVIDYVLLRDSECLGLLGNLLVNLRDAYETRADNIGADAMCGALIGDGFANPIRPCLAAT